MKNVGTRNFLINCALRRIKFAPQIENAINQYILGNLSLNFGLLNARLNALFIICSTEIERIFQFLTNNVLKQSYYN